MDPVVLASSLVNCDVNTAYRVQLCRLVFKLTYVTNKLDKDGSIEAIIKPITYLQLVSGSFVYHALASLA